MKIKKIKIYQFTRKKIETKENWSVNKISKIEKGKINKGEEREKGLDVDFMNYRLIINWMFLYLKIFLIRKSFSNLEINFPIFWLNKGGLGWRWCKRVEEL